MSNSGELHRRIVRHNKVSRAARIALAAGSALSLAGCTLSSSKSNQSDYSIVLPGQYTTPDSNFISTAPLTTTNTLPSHAATANVPKPLVKKLYLVGDSYTERATENGLAGAVKHAGGSIMINYDPSRSITVGGFEHHQSGLAAIQADRAKVNKANAVIVQLGTNGGDTPTSIATVITTIKKENSRATIYWMNLGALGYAPASHQAATMAEFNTENSYLESSAPKLGFRILNWCGDVFKGSAVTCRNDPADIRQGILASDDVHPSIQTGISDFNKLIVSTLSR
jgi:hypothetical protein